MQVQGSVTVNFFSYQTFKQEVNASYFLYSVCRNEEVKI